MKGEGGERVESKRTVSAEWPRNENYTLQQIRRPTGRGAERNRKAEPQISVSRAPCDVRGKGTRVILLVRNSEQTLFLRHSACPKPARRTNPKWASVHLYAQKVISRATSTITAAAGSNGSVSLCLPPSLPPPDHYPPQPLLLLVII